MRRGRASTSFQMLTTRVSVATVPLLLVLLLVPVSLGDESAGSGAACSTCIPGCTACAKARRGDVVCMRCAPGRFLAADRRSCPPCAAGFYSPGGTAAACLKCPAGTSSGERSGTCDRIVCAAGPASPVANGAWPGGSKCTNAPVNSTCTATCFEGFKGSPTATCVVDLAANAASWSAVVNICKEYCAKRPVKRYLPQGGGTIAYKWSSGCNEYVVGRGCTGTAVCISQWGRRMVNASATCIIDGAPAKPRWTVTDTCRPCAGTALPNGANAEFNNSTCSGGWLGQECLGSCATGFTGAPKATCGPTGAWRVDGSCTQIVCKGSPPDPVNGAFACGETTLPGGRCNATCAAGFTGAPMATCRLNGAWSAVDGSCAQIEGLPVRLDITLSPGQGCPPPSQLQQLFAAFELIAQEIVARFSEVLSDVVYDFKTYTCSQGAGNTPTAMHLNAVLVANPPDTPTNELIANLAFYGITSGTDVCGVLPNGCIQPVASADIIYLVPSARLASEARDTHRWGGSWALPAPVLAPAGP